MPSITSVVERLPQQGALAPLARAGRLADGIFTGKDDRSVSQRIALIAFSTRIVSALIAYLSQVLLARWMGDYEYGVFVMVWVAAVIIGGLACFGFQKSIVRFVPEYQERREDDLLRGVLVGSRLQGLFTATVIALVGMAGLGLFEGIVTSHYLIPLYLAAICLPMLAVAEIQEGMSRAFNWADLALWPTFIYRPLLILLVMWLALRLGFAANAVTAMGSVIVATYIATVWQFVSLQLRLRKTVPAGPHRYQTLKWIGISLPIFLVEGFFNLLTNVDIIIVGQFVPPDQVAVYYAATKTLALVHFVYFSVRAGAAHRISQYYTAGDRVRLEALVRDTLHWTFWPSLGLAALLLLLGKPLLGLFGPSFVDGYPLLFIFTIGLVFRASVGPAESLLSMSGQQRICATVYFLTFLFNVAMNFLLIPRYGLHGAAIATTIALFVEAAGLFVVTWSRLGIRCSILFAFGPSWKAAEEARA
jgi:O-antigen/teichoic acid export membrane protein